MKGIILVNLGTPDEPEKKAVKKYLNEFLMDKYVIDIPYFSRLLLVKGIILNTRPKKSAAAYRKVWTDRGSPLMFHSQDLVDKVQSKIENPVELAMRYNQPSIKSAIIKLKEKGCDEILFFPLYPQYAESSTRTIIEKATIEMKKVAPGIKFDFVDAFYNEEKYISILSSSIQNHLDKNKFDYILFSYHGIPERQLEKADPTKSHCNKIENCCQIESDAHQFCYKHQSYVITQKVVEKLNLKKGTYGSSFQSRLGRTEWVKPYTDFRLKELPGEGKKRLLVVTPSFVADCLETIEEIGMEGKEVFLENGGEEYDLVECFNSSNDWVDYVCEKVS